MADVSWWVCGVVTMRLGMAVIVGRSRLSCLLGKRPESMSSHLVLTSDVDTRSKAM